MATATARAAVCFSLSAGQAHNAPEGEALLGKMNKRDEQKHLLMDSAYESALIRKAVTEKVLLPIMPPKPNRKKSMAI